MAWEIKDRISIGTAQYNWRIPEYNRVDPVTYGTGWAGIAESTERFCVPNNAKQATP